jgi:nucleoside-diphosphate-sugar epimerase
MDRKIFLAGASGAIGRRLALLLVAAGYEVFGTTRSPVKATELEALGVKPIVIDVFDGPALSLILTTVQPDIVIHQLTDLPRGLPPSQRAEATARNARMRREGTANLVAAARAASARRLIAQSIAWVYAPGAEPHLETDPLDYDAEGTRRISVQGVAALEQLTLSSPPIEGVVLRYGQLYGPATGNDQPNGSAPLHVDAAAQAALLAITRGQPGIYNIAEDTGLVSSAKARKDLGWRDDFRIAEAS